MPNSVTDQLAAIIVQIDERGSADQLRLTVLKKWFVRPGRLAAFALWVAARATANGRATSAPAAELFGEAQALLQDGEARGRIDLFAAEGLHRRLAAFQSTYQRAKWGAVRIIANANLLLIEDALALYLWHSDSPPLGYKLAAAYCVHYDPHYGTGLNGPSRARLEELIDFIKRREAFEAKAPEGVRPMNNAP